MHQNLAVILWQLYYSTISFIVSNPALRGFVYVFHAKQINSKIFLPFFPQTILTYLNVSKFYYIFMLHCNAERSFITQYVFLYYLLYYSTTNSITMLPTQLLYYLLYYRLYFSTMYTITQLPTLLLYDQLYYYATYSISLPPAL